MQKLTSVEKNQLIDTLTDGFNLTELKKLSARLGIDEDSLDTSNKDNLIIDLLAYLERRQQIADLLALGKKQRPELDWPEIGTANTSPSSKTAQPDSVTPPETTSPTKPNKVLISYSHQDEEWKDLFVKPLRVLEKQGLLNLWVDRDIPAGANWEQEIENAIAQTRVAILLVSDDFLGSDFITNKEVPYFLQRREAGTLAVFPVIIKDCFWDMIDWLNVIQVRPKDGKPLSDFDKAEREKIVREIVRETHKLLS